MARRQSVIGENNRANQQSSSAPDDGQPAQSRRQSVIEPKDWVNQQNWTELPSELDDGKPTQSFIRDRKCQLFLIVVIFTFIVPTLIFYFLIHQADYEKDYSYTCSLDVSYRVSCGKVNISQSECIKLQCCYDYNPNGCYHAIPSVYNYRNDPNSNAVFRPRQSVTPFHNQSLPELKLSFREINEGRLQIIVHTPNSSYQYDPVLNKQYRVKTNQDPMGVEVFRVDTEELILTTLRGPLIASDGYWEWSFQLIGEKLCGLGEIAMTNETMKKVIYKNRNDHTTTASFMAYSKGSFHGVVVEHDGPLEVAVSSSRLIALRSLDETKLVLNLCTGPTPQDLVKQMRSFEVVPPPYWALGTHICRDGSTTMEAAIREYEGFIKDEGTIQYDSDCIHENLYAMLHESSAGEELKKLIEDLRQKSHFLMSLPPQILRANQALYNKSVDLGVLYRNKVGEVLDGYYLQQEAVYPDFTHSSINMWMEALKESLPAPQIDGFVLRDNWPEEETYIFSDKDYKFPYITEDLNSSLSGTIPWDALTSGPTPQLHITQHNQYGKSQGDAFRNYMDYEFLLTSSYSYGVQEAAAVQNVNISWTNLKRAIVTTLHHSIFGNPLLSVPVCGSTKFYDESLHEQLCIRWYLVAATFPLFRISSELPRRDPSSLGSGFARAAVLKALERRYMLLPYYHTTLTAGNPLIRPMFYDFYSDNETLALDEQYMLGKSLLVAQPLLPNAMYLWVYLPPSVGVWYEFWGGRSYTTLGRIRIPVLETDWVMFLAQGHIVPLRNNKQKKVGSGDPDDTFGLAVALKCNSTACVSEGSLKLNQAVLTFHADEVGVFVGNVTQGKSDIGCDSAQRNWPSIIENAIVYGVGETAARYKFDNFDLCQQTEDDIYIKYIKEVV